MIEIISIISVIFLISVFFYKRAQEEVNLLQIEAENIEKLPRVLTEMNPVIVRGFQGPPVWRKDDIMAGRLGGIIKGLKSRGMDKDASMNLAEESGLRVWIEHTIYPKLVWEYLQLICWPITQAEIGSRGLWKTVAYTTIILPTDKELVVTLMTSKNRDWLPSEWANKDPNGFTKKDSPMVQNLKMADIIVRPGAFLCVPSHWYVYVSGEEVWWTLVEVHHPISWILEKVNSKSSSG